MTEVLAPQPGDTVAWKNRRTHQRCWGLLEWTDDKGHHLLVSQAGHSKIRTVIKPENVTNVWPGREEFDRHVR